MNYIVKLTFFAYIISKLAVTSNVNYMEVIVLLLAAALSAFMEKFGGSLVLYVLEAVIIYIGITLDPVFAMLYGFLVYDLIGSKYYSAVAAVVFVGLFTLEFSQLIDFLLVIGLCCIFAYVRITIEAKELLYRDSYDRQREYSYQLEQAKARLISSAEEATHMAEIKERNRIARQIHDNVGHSIAGILMQLQAVVKLFDRDSDKSKELLQSSVTALANTLTTMRDTVHNIKPTEKLGVEYLKHIVDEFSYCPVEFVIMGDFEQLPVNVVQILTNNMKEALTNISRYSKATLVDIKVDINESYARLYIKDNGIGNTSYKEGLGLSGMKERVQNAGGTISISGNNGFLIVCVIPNKKSKEAEQ